MSCRVSSFAGAVTLFVAFLAAFASASPANTARGELGVERRNNEVEGVPSQVDTTDSTSDFSATHEGRGTWYYPGLGNCGTSHTAGDLIVALSWAYFDHGSACGKEVKVTNTQTGKSTTVTVGDVCPQCGGGDVDLSPAAFQAIAPLAEGVIRVIWEFV